MATEDPKEQAASDAEPALSEVESAAPVGVRRPKLLPAEPTAAEAEPKPARSAQGGAPRPKPRPRKWLRRTLLGLLGLLVLGAIAAALGYRPLVRYLAVREARKYGIALVLGEVNLGWSRVTLRECEFTTIGFEGVHGRFDQLEVALAGMVPQRVEARGVDLDLVGSAATLAVGLSDWTKSYPLLLKIPSKADAVGLVWRTEPGGTPWLTLSGATIEPAPTGGQFAASRAQVVGVDVGRVGASWTGTASSIALGFGETDLAQAPVVIEVHYADAEPAADITLRPTPLEKLAGPLGMALPLKGVSASARMQLQLKGEAGQGAVLGSLQADLSGYTPPMPSELKSFAFGSDTHLECDFEISNDRRRVEIRRAEITHGAFKLEGKGTIERQPDHALVVLDLAGHLSCAEVAKAMARARLGGQWGGLIGPAVDLTVQGSITIGVKLEVDTRNLLAAKLTPKVSLGCGLRSLDKLFALPALPSLRLPKGK